MFGEKAIEIAIGGINGYIKPSKAERQAAYELFVELSSRTATISDEDDDNRPADEILRELTAMAEITRSILRSNGADSAKGRADGNVTLAVIALRVLNEIISPRVHRWSPRLREHEEARPDDFSGSAAAWEKKWNEFGLCREDLDSMRVEVRSYMDTLAKIAGAAALADVVVPVPPSAPIPAGTLPETLEPGYGQPKRQMVPWLDPIEVARSIWAHHVAAKQIEQDQRAHVHAPDSDGGTIKIVHDEREALWVDYVSDLGDAIDPTIAVAWQLTQEAISLPEDRSGELPKPPPTLPRGRLLVMGGDQIYPFASEHGYTNQLEMPYRLAAEANALIRDQRVDGAVTETDGDTEDEDREPAEGMEDRPIEVGDVALATNGPDTNHGHDIVAIPGNHDWLGGSKHFEKVFVGSTEFANDWNTPQTRRWWAIKLTAGWWMWGLDTALDDTLDQAQIEYFEAASKELRAGDQVIICSPVPLWQLRQKRQDAYFEIRAILRRLIRDSGAHSPLFLAGDSHFFAHYRRVDGAADEHHITAGGGGAFLQPTHNLPEQVPYEKGAPDFKLGARWPRPVDSRNLGTSLGGIKGRQFGLLMLIIAVFHAAVARLAAAQPKTFDATSSRSERAADAITWVLGRPAIWLVLLVLVFAIAKGNLPNSRETNLRTGALRYGLMHGVAHGAVFVAVAAFALWTNADSPLWRYVGAPLIGGALSTVLFVWFVRWINRAIRASDTMAFAPAHGTRYKHFVRMCFQPNGNLQLYVIGIDPVGENWYQAITGRSGGVKNKTKRRTDPSLENPGRAIVRRYVRTGSSPRRPQWNAERLVPPYDSAGVPKLHYVWGRHFRAASSELLLERERILGVDHPDTIFSRKKRAEHIYRHYHKTAESVELLKKNVTSCERRFGATHRTTLANRALLGDGLLAMGDSAHGLEELRKVVEGRQANFDASSSDATPPTHGERTRKRRAVQAQIHYARAGNDHEEFVIACAALEDGDSAQSENLERWGLHDLEPWAHYELARAHYGLNSGDDEKRRHAAKQRLAAIDTLWAKQKEHKRSAAVDDRQLRLLVEVFKAEIDEDDESKGQKLRRLLRDCEQQFGKTDRASLNARRALGEALVLGPSTERHAREGLEFLRENVEILDGLLGMHHETVKARQVLATALLEESELAGARAQYQEIVDFHTAFETDSPAGLNNLLEAAVASSKDNPGAAITRLRELLVQSQSMRDVDPRFPLHVRLELARSLTKEKRFDEANVEYEQLVNDGTWRALAAQTEGDGDEARFLTEARVAWAESLGTEGKTGDSATQFMTAFEEGPPGPTKWLAGLKLVSMNAKLFAGGVAEFKDVEEMASYLQKNRGTSHEQGQLFLEYLSSFEDPDVAIPILEAWPPDDDRPIREEFLARAELNRRRRAVSKLCERYWDDAEADRPLHEYQAEAAQAMVDILAAATELEWLDSQPVIEVRIELASMYEAMRERPPDDVDESTLAVRALEQWEEVAAVVGERLPDSALHIHSILHVAVLSLDCEDPDRAIAMCSLAHDRLDAMSLADANAILSADLWLGNVNTAKNTPDNIVEVKTTLARAYLEAGQLDKAEDLARQAVALAAAVFPRGHYTRHRAAGVLTEARARRSTPQPGEGPRTGA